jgi:hypothetical protein
VDYLPANNLLVASGCYWACPYSLILLDFSDPLIEHPWVDVVDKLGEDEYDSADFRGFDGTTVLAESLYVDENPPRKLTLRIPEEQYHRWLDAA